MLVRDQDKENRLLKYQIPVSGVQTKVPSLLPTLSFA